MNTTSTDTVQIEFSREGLAMFLQWLNDWGQTPHDGLLNVFTVDEFVPGRGTLMVTSSAPE